MFNHIIAPVDLAHLETLERALDVTFSEAKHHGSKVTLVSVTSSNPKPVANTTKGFAQKLTEFAESQAKRHGLEVDAMPLVVNDFMTHVDEALLKAVSDSGADLVIMASHKPGLAEYFWPSNGGKIAAHAAVSVMLVRDA